MVLYFYVVIRHFGFWKITLVINQKKQQVNLDESATFKVFK